MVAMVTRRRVAKACFGAAADAFNCGEQDGVGLCFAWFRVGNARAP